MPHVNQLRHDPLSEYNSRMQQIQDILRCPVTGSSLREISHEEIREANRRIAARTLLQLSGRPVETEIQAGVVSEDGSLAYRLEDGIFILLSELAIVLRGDPEEYGNLSSLGETKKGVQDFYNQTGWLKENGQSFTDALLFEDLRPVSRDYNRDCRLRINDCINSTGRLILDVASGPVQYEEYLTYSAGYDFRICIDLSLRALREAKARLADRGIYVLADITKLPLRDNSLDAVVSLHTIYHVPREEQAAAFHEIHRVLKQGCSAAVVYSWGDHSFLMKAAFLPAHIFRMTARLFPAPLRKIIKRILGMKTAQPGERDPAPAKPDFYSYRHDYNWFKSQKWEFSWEVRTWKSLSVEFTRTFIPDNPFGKRMLTFVYRLEERFPHALGRLGQYPLFVITKRAA